MYLNQKRMERTRLKKTNITIKLDLFIYFCKSNLKLHVYRIIYYILIYLIIFFKNNNNLLGAMHYGFFCCKEELKERDGERPCCSHCEWCQW